MPPTLLTHGHTLSASSSHTLTETLRGQRRSWGTSPVRLYKCWRNLIGSSCLDQVTGIVSGSDGKKTEFLQSLVICNYSLPSKVQSAFTPSENNHNLTLSLFTLITRNSLSEQVLKSDNMSDLNVADLWFAWSTGKKTPKRIKRGVLVQALCHLCL